MPSTIARIALGVLLVSGSWLAACGGEEAAPVTAAKAYADAVASRDVDALLPLLERRAAERLTSAAERASDQVGGRRNIEALEMLQIVDVDPRFQVARAELVDADATSARVRLIGADGKEHLLDLVLEDDDWHVKIPVPEPLRSETPT